MAALSSKAAFFDTASGLKPFPGGFHQISCRGCVRVRLAVTWNRVVGLDMEQIPVISRVAGDLLSLGRSSAPTCVSS